MAAEMWYYTSEGKQMDPVTMKELKRLVGEFVLVTCLFAMVIGAVFLFKSSGDSKNPIVDEKKDKLPPLIGEEKYDVQLAGNQSNKKSFGLKNGVSYDVRIMVLEPADP